MNDDEFDSVMSVGHGELRFYGYEVAPDGRERALYVTEWESPGSFIKDQGISG